MSIKRWLNTGLQGLANVAIAGACAVNLVGGSAAAKELWNTVPPLTDTSKASAAILDAIAGGYNAFGIGELNGVDARKKSLAEAGDRLIEASNVMFATVDIMKAQGLGFEQANFDKVEPNVKAVFDNWLTSIGGKEPRTVIELYMTAADGTKLLGEKYKGWSERIDDQLFFEFVGTTAAYLQAGWTGSRVFETSN